MGEAEFGSLRLQFDRSVKLAFQGTSISSDGGLLRHRELDDALGLIDMGAELIVHLAARESDQDRHAAGEHARYAVFQFAEAALPRPVFAGILVRINGQRGPPAEALSA